ncbi:Rho GDP-dissociation inhibitor [Phaffia rhodozyma]|uniref:Rho GDP-dissociation inhibitor n=1 Tax=Phaffia rhodozyma TaxID=264483 RepID=A0A0F7SX49_PHARH|nr:Rho GDP-dissociation inhibitor [Phaffia rhodozyma]
MSHTVESSGINDDDLTPSTTAGYKLGQERSLAELAALDQEDESLQKWKASLGLNTGAVGQAGPKRSPDEIAKLKKNPINIKEGIEYSVGIEFTVENQIVSGLKYLQLVKRSGIKVDKTEKMIGSHGPQAEPYSRIIAEEESPSGMLARSGTYNVRSRIVDDDGVVYVDFEWAFKLTTSW